MSNAKIFDNSGLPDMQKLGKPSVYGVPINKVGVNNVRLPIKYRRLDGTIRTHDTTASAYVSLLKPDVKGISMSRMTIAFHKYLELAFDWDYIDYALDDLAISMRDSEEDPAVQDVYIKLKFNYHIEQQSLKSGHQGWQYYPCELEGVKREDSKRLFLTVTYQYSSTCPCSFELSKTYMEQYAAGLTTEGNGTATAHAQRSTMRLTVELDPSKPLHIEELVTLLRDTLPTEVQVIVKRTDEQAFAILNGSHKLFVEDAVRLVASACNQEPRILDYVVVSSHEESLHPSDATAVIAKGIPGGLR